MKKISRKLWYVLLMVVVISGMLLFIPGSLYACTPNTLTVTVHKAIEGTGFGVFSFELWVGDESNAPSLKSTNTIPAEGGTCTLTWTDNVSDAMATVYVVESGNGGATETSWSFSDPASTSGDTTSTFTWSRLIDYTKDVYFKNVITAPTPTVDVVTAAAPAVPTVYTITATTEGPGSITDLGVFNISAGNDKIYTITADGGASIVDVWVNGASLGPVSSNTFLHVNSNQTIHVKFVKVEVLALIEEAATVEVEAITEPAAEVIEVAAITELPRTGNNMLFYVIGFALMAVGVAFGSFFIPKALRKR